MAKKLKPVDRPRKSPAGFGVLAHVKPDEKGVLRDGAGLPVLVTGGAMVDGGDEIWEEDIKRKAQG